MKINRTVVAAIIAASLVGGVAACSSSAGGGGGGGYHRIPEPWDSQGGNANPAPGPKVDAEPRPSLPAHVLLTGNGIYDCNVYLETASGLIAGGNMVDGDVFGFCTGTPPTGITFKLSIWTHNVTHQLWFETPESVRTFQGAPQPFPDTSHYTTSAYCVPGQYKIYMAMFHNGEKVIENFGDTIRFSQAQCGR
jgi:hypothetical protein